MLKNVESFLEKAIRSPKNIQQRKDSIIGGVYNPAIAFQWVMGLNIFPFGHSMELFGNVQTFKSTLTYQIGRWFYDSGSLVVYIDTEHKRSESMFESFFKDEDGAVIYIDAYLVQDWQIQLTEQIKSYLELANKAQKKGLVIPIIVVIDSLIGAADEDTVKKVSKEGMAGTSFAAKPAQSIAPYWPSLKALLEDSPYFLIYTNQIREKINTFSYGRTYDTPGGYTPKFHASIRMELISKQLIRKYKDLMTVGKILRMTTVKNSLAPSHISCDFEVRWDRNYQDNKFIQETYFDWNKATGDLIAELATHGDYSQLKELLGLSKVGSSLTATRYSQDELSTNELGAYIQSDLEIIPEVQQILRIERRPIYYDGKFYTQEEYFKLITDLSSGSSESGRSS